MGSKPSRSLTELTDEELLSLAETEGEITTLDTGSDVREFINRYQISTGSHKVSIDQLHSFYKVWSGRPLNKPKFKEELGILLDQIIVNTVKLSKKPIQLVHKKKSPRLNLLNYYRFIKDLDIKEGPVNVHLSVVCSLYNKWAKTNKKFRSSKQRFTKAISKWFKIKTIKNVKYISVDKETSKKLVELVHEEQKEKQEKIQ